MADPLISSDALPRAVQPSRATLSLAHYLLAAALGALNTLSFAPVPHGGWFEIVVFIGAFWLLTRTRTWRGAALTGGAFGFGNFVSGVWWLYVSMHFYGGMAPLLAGAAVVLFSLYLALYPALAGALWHLCSRHSRAHTAWWSSLVFASAWALGEWLRGTALTGFPWLASGYPQVDGPLSGYAPLVGVYGVGWVLALIAALVVQAIGGSRVATQRRLDQPALPAGAARSGFALLPALLALLLVAGGIAGSRHAWTEPSGAPLSVRLLQGNVPQSMKFEQAGIDHAISLYQQLITQKAADLIVTPETGISVLIQQVPQAFGQAVRQFVDSTGSSVLFGAVGAKLTDQGPTDITNSLFGVTPGTQTLYRYDKHHLVPFGEFVPYGFHWFVQMLNIPLGDQSRGVPVQAAFTVHGERVVPNICYEDIFGEEIARSLRADAPAQILVNASNLGWFGNTVALEQHLQIARMRTLETGRPLVSATNTGITAAIRADGTVQGRLAPFTVGSLDLNVQGTVGRTPYVSLGNTPVVLGSLILLVLGAAWAVRRRSKDAAKVAKGRHSR